MDYCIGFDGTVRVAYSFEDLARKEKARKVFEAIMANDMTDINGAEHDEKGRFTGKGGGSVEAKKKSTGAEKTTNSSKKQVVYLDRKEYGHVMHELNTHLTDEEREKNIIIRAIGNYEYMIENKGFNEYVILERNEIE